MIKSRILLLFPFYFSLLCELSGRVGGLGPAVDGEEVGVGLIVDMGSKEGKVFHGRVSMAISDFNSFGRDNQMRIVLHTRDSKGDLLLALSFAFNLWENNKVKVILSAQKSTLEAKFLAEFGNNTKIPVIPISAPYLIQAPPHDHAEVKGIVAFAELHKWEKVILIYEDHNDNHWSDFFEEKKFQVAYKSSVAASSKDEHIIEELHRLKAMETSVLVVHVEPVLASRIFVHAKRLGMVSQGYAWIVTSKCMNHLQNLKDYSSILENMQGFIGFRSYNIKESKEFDMLQLMNFTQMVNFGIVNVLGTEGERRVGFWTGKFTNKLSHGFTHGRHLFSSSGFETIIWPGGTSTIPKGRRMQTSTKTLRIAVPKSNGFPQLLKVDIDLQTNITFSGFCIEVFKAAMAGLEHTVPYEFVSFEYNNPNIGEAYSDLVYQLYLQTYDAIAGDITITANRSLYVDFTLPFTEMGIGMVTRLPPKESQNLWIFLKPLSPGLWLTIVGVYVLSALFIWLIERPAFVERQTRQSNGEIGRMFGFSFSIFVFTHWEKLSSNLSRSVVVLWVFVVFILGSNYTATLTSMMTVQQIEFNSGKSIIGRATGPVTQGAIGNLNFPNSHSKSIRLTSLEEYAKALSEGSKNGGVSAIIEEMPYINILRQKYPTRYSMVGHVMPVTNGFGFAFPKGSPMANDISREIAKLREDGTLQKLENEWFKSPIIDFDSDNTLGSMNSLTVRDFQGLFLISGIYLAIACFLFLTSLLYKNFHVMKEWRRPKFVEQYIYMKIFRNKSNANAVHPELDNL
ncbi:hypothetical protein ES288_A07G104700v1 [Gossypium darwinii]|uniref:Glutamate receptor n=1 Tax=Gossypium darwinii TaxID=34276 RepID=A0A5D2FW05_GOSDA|nr:hypothetical protein ES288_A07G104700v1 [Gossypium darwinii]